MYIHICMYVYIYIYIHVAHAIRGDVQGGLHRLVRVPVGVGGHHQVQGLAVLIHSYIYISTCLLICLYLYIYIYIHMRVLCMF